MKAAKRGRPPAAERAADLINRAAALALLTVQSGHTCQCHPKATAKEIAALFHVTPRTLRRWKRELPESVYPG